MQCGTVDCLPGAVGSVVKPCADMEGGIWVHVLDDLGDTVPGATALKNEGDEQVTDPGGLAKWDPLPAAQYVAKLALSAEMAKEYELPARFEEPVRVSKGQITYVGFELRRKMNDVKPTLIVDLQEVQAPFPEAKAVAEEIHTFQPKKPDAKDDPQVVAVTASYTESFAKYAYDKGGTVAVTGVKASFWKDSKCKEPVADNGGQLAIENGDLKAGYTFYLRLEEAGDAKVSLTLDDSTKVRVVVDKAPIQKDVKVKPVNRVTPYVKVEHLVVLRDQELWKEQRKNDTAAGSAAVDAADRIKPDRIRVELSAAKTAEVPNYTGKGKLTFSSAKVKAFVDETSDTAFDLTAGIEFEKLLADQPFTIWLQGAEAGTFDVVFKLDAATDSAIKVDDEAKGQMGCVDLKLNLYQYKESDVNQAVEPDVADVDTFWNELKALTFEQKAMTPAERVGTGRMIHAQKDKTCARAKVIVERVEAHWPAAAKDYSVVVDVADGDKKGKTRSGTLKLFDAEVDGTELTLPKKLTLEKADEKKEMWVEGITPCDGWRAIRLSVGIDRDTSGPEKKPKLDADWGSFTIVKIKEVKCDIANEGGQEKFTDGNKVFINVDDKGRLLKSVGGKRKAEITATIEPALKDVDVYFSVVEHPDNYKVDKLPDAFKQKKIAALKHRIKASDKTDRKKLLHVSAKTDDTGKAKIETLEAPQLALQKFKVGAYILQNPQHARYIEEHPDLKEHPPTLSPDWMEVWRRLFYRVVAMKRFSGASYLDRFEEDALIAQMKAVGIDFEKTAPHVEADYKKSIPDDDTADWVRAAMGVGGNQARTQYLALMDSNRDGTSDVDIQFTSMPATSTTLTRKMAPVFDSDNGTAWLKSVDISYDGWSINSPGGAGGVLSIAQTEDFGYTFTIDLSARHAQILSSEGAPKAADFLQNVDVKFTVVTGDADSGMSYDGCTMIFMRGREQRPDPASSSTHTFLHEIGHYVGLGCKTLPDTADTLNPQFYDENFTNAHGYGGYGLGAHCDGLGCNCIMWYSFKMTHVFCDTCLLSLRARALHAPKVSGRDAF